MVDVPKLPGAFKSSKTSRRIKTREAIACICIFPFISSGVGEIWMVIADCCFGRVVLVLEKINQTGTMPARFVV
jgi:hypothetical protein